ncbi:hypothetical protein MPER_01669, partial [Moniliophthora perniciosa FA553]
SSISLSRYQQGVGISQPAVKVFKHFTMRQAASQPENQEEFVIDASVRSLVCEDCWVGPFCRESWRKLMNSEEVTYTTAWSRVQASADHGCGFCRILIIDKEDDCDEDQVSFRLSFGTFHLTSIVQPITPSPVQYMMAEVEGYESLSSNKNILYASPNDPAATEITARDCIRDVRFARAYSWHLSAFENGHDHESVQANESPAPDRVLIAVPRPKWC